MLTVDAVKNAPNFVFSSDVVFSFPQTGNGNIRTITNSTPKMKLITLDENNIPFIVD